MSYRKNSSAANYPTIKVKVPASNHHKAYTAVRKDLGNPGIGPTVIPIMAKGSLSKFGYSTKKSDQARHAALDKAVKKYGAMTVFRKLQAQVILRKRTQPKIRDIFTRDAEWVRDNKT